MCSLIVTLQILVCSSRIDQVFLGSGLAVQVQGEMSKENRRHSSHDSGYNFQKEWL